MCSEEVEDVLLPVGSLGRRADAKLSREAATADSPSQLPAQFVLVGADEHCLRGGEVSSRDKLLGRARCQVSGPPSVGVALVLDNRDGQAAVAKNHFVFVPRFVHVMRRLIEVPHHRFVALREEEK